MFENEVEKIKNTVCSFAPENIKTTLNFYRWGVYEPGPGYEGFFGTDDNWFVYYVSDRMDQSFVGPIRNNEIVGYIGQGVFGFNVGDNSLNISQIIDINGRKVKSYNDVQNYLTKGIVEGTRKNSFFSRFRK